MSNILTNVILKLKRGNLSNLPSTANDGELLVAAEQNGDRSLYIGTSTTVKPLIDESIRSRNSFAVYDSSYDSTFNNMFVTYNASTGKWIKAYFHTATDLQATAIGFAQYIASGQLLITTAGKVTGTSLFVDELGANIQAGKTYYLTSNSSNAGKTTLTEGDTPTVMKVTQASSTGYELIICIGVDNGNANSDRLHALKSYEDAGELLTDTEGLADVTSYAHSTFDLSKFTQVGSPTITDDGIASGFSASNYITSSLSLDNLKTFEIILKFHTPSSISGSNMLIGRASYPLMIFRIDSSQKIFCEFSITSSTRHYKSSTFTLEMDADYFAKINYDLTSVYFSISTDKTTWTNLATFSNITDFTSTISYTTGIGRNLGSEFADYFTGSIDLKQFSITADGVLIFNGNKTGIDTIKADNYTVVGSPTISDDGVASGFSSDNYLYTNNFSFGSSSWEIITAFTFTGTGSGNKTLYAGKSTNASAPMVYVQNSQFSCYVPSAVGTWGYTKAGVSHTFTTNTKYWIKFGYNNENSHYYAKISTDGINYTTKFDEEDTTVLLGGTGSFDLSLGYNKGYNMNPFDNGSIDLNAFKIYVNGDLVYQPCLKIPYTQSKTGSKIADNYYLDRVSDMYSQFGYAPYYTLNEGTNFTLPMGEIYGMYINKSELVEFNPMITSYINGTSGYNIWANGYCEQWGVYSGTIGGYGEHTITLIKTYNGTDFSVEVTGAPADYIVGANPVTASTFVHRSRFYDDDLGGNTTTTTVYWVTRGYLAAGQY